MIAGDNPPEFSHLERRLQSRRGAEPSEGLCARIMLAVEDELSRSTVPIRNGGDLLSFAAAMAAVLVLALNLSIIATSATAFESHPPITREQAMIDAKNLQQLSPGLSRVEAMRFSVLLQAGGQLAPLPDMRLVRSISRGQTAIANPERNLK